MENNSRRILFQSTFLQSKPKPQIKLLFFKIFLKFQKFIFYVFRYFSARRRKRYQLIPRVICQIWDFCTESAELLYPRGHVRLIVTRVGRIGAGETKEWAKIIPQNRSRKHKDDLNRPQIISGKHLWKFWKIQKFKLALKI